MSPFDALTEADPAKQLGPRPLDEGAEQLLREILSTAPAQHLGAARARTGAPVRDRRSVVATVAVSVAVVIAAVFAIRLAAAPRSGPADTVAPTSAPAPTGTRPTPGQILTSLTSADGRDQTATVAANGSALTVEYSCTGSGTVSVTIGDGPGFSDSQCTGPSTVSSRTALNGTARITVRSTGSATWTATVTATAAD